MFNNTEAKDLTRKLEERNKEIKELKSKISSLEYSLDGIKNMADNIYYAKTNGYARDITSCDMYLFLAWFNGICDSLPQNTDSYRKIMTSVCFTITHIFGQTRDIDKLLEWRKGIEKEQP